MNPRRLLARLAAGSLHNVRFADLRRLAESLGWELQRTNGSHHIFKHPNVDELMSLQDHRGAAKPYQIRQFLQLVERYDLRTE